MTLRELLDSKKAELADLKERTGQLEQDIEAIERVLAMNTETAIPAEVLTTKNLKDIYGSFGKFIAQFRFENGLTKRDLAKLIGVSDVSVSNWETKNSLPTTVSRKNIAEKIRDLSANEYKVADIMEFFK